MKKTAGLANVWQHLIVFFASASFVVLLGYFISSNKAEPVQIPVDVRNLLEADVIAPTTAVETHTIPTSKPIERIKQPTVPQYTLRPHQPFATLAPPRKLPDWCPTKKGGSPITVTIWLNSWSDVNDINKGCEDRCVYLKNDLKAAEVVIYFPFGNNAIPELTSSQVLAVWAREPQQFTEHASNPWKNDQLRGKVDIAMTYNLDSNIPVTYMWPNLVEQAYSHPIPTKADFDERRAAVWMSRNCDASEFSRPKVVQILQRYIHIDCRGSCLNNAPQWEGPPWDAAPYYKLYLGFEKSIEDEYVTEKFMNPIMKNSLLVYIGTSRAHIYAPSNHSYIDALSFANASALGEYLKKVIDNYDEWVSYFQWRKDPIPQRLLDYSQYEEGRSHLCRVCDCVCNATCNNGLRPGNGIGRNVYSAAYVREVWSV